MSFELSGIEQNPKLGYYKVGDRIFYSKPQAYIYGTQVGIDPMWVFNPLEFGKFNWTAEPELDLRELYRLRAQQLRDRYDWIRIECSGGGDSTTAVYSFLLNGIHLDEIVFRYPAQVDKNVTDDPTDTRPENTLSEWRYAAKPLLDWVKTKFPKTVVTFHDYSDKLLKSADTRDESWVFTTRDWFQPGHGNKHDHFGTAEHRALADSGKSLCVLYGVDKPKVALLGGAWYLYFTDMHANGPSPEQKGYTNITSELFYWTPDLPELVCKQAHMVKRWFDTNPHLQYVLEYPVGNTNHRTTYEHIAKSIIYPDYDLDTWQTNKPTNSFYNEMDHWFYTNLKGTKLYSAWEAGLSMLVDKIDPKHFKYQLGQPTGLKAHCSMFYYLGPGVDVDAGIRFNNRDYLSEISHTVQVVEKRKLKKIQIN
jgi:hypothetical protein